MFNNGFLSMEEAEERMRKHIKDAEDYKLYKQLGHTQGFGTWVVVLIILIVASWLIVFIFMILLLVSQIFWELSEGSAY
jgi:hypothetical protein